MVVKIDEIFITFLKKLTETGDINYSSRIISCSNLPLLLVHSENIKDLHKNCILFLPFQTPK